MKEVRNKESPAPPPVTKGSPMHPVPQSSASYSHPSPKHVEVLQPANRQYQPQHVPSPPPSHPSPTQNGMKKVHT